MSKSFLRIISAAILFLSVSLCSVTVTKAEPEFDINARAGLLMEYETGTILYEKNIDQPLPIASVTKIMSLCLIFDEVEQGTLKLDDKVTVSEYAANIGGSHVFTDAHWQYPASELIKSIIIASANDACIAMAEHIAGNEETFVSRMNKKAEELGMNNTTFVNCTGLPAEGHLSTARDVAIMSRELLGHKDYFRWSSTWMDEITHKDGRVTGLTNTNKLVRFYEGCDGVKTGYTDEAKHCLSASATRNGTRMISVILGGETSQNRFDDARTLLNYGFANFVTVKLVNKDDVIEQQPAVKNGMDKTMSVHPAWNVTAVLHKGEEKLIEKEIALPSEIAAPIKAGQKVGELIIRKDGEEMMRVDLVADRDYKEAKIWDILKRIISLW